MQTLEILEPYSLPGICSPANRLVNKTQTEGEEDKPWCVDHLQEDRKILGAVPGNDPRTPFWHRCVEEGRRGKHVAELGGRKGDNGRVDPENCVSAHDLYVSVLEIKCLVVSRDLFAIALFGAIFQFGCGKVGYGGDAQRGGRGCGDSVAGR